MRSQTYSEYLALEELLSIQREKSDGPEHDELLFIVIHQVYELWFKQELHEVDYLCEQLDGNNASRALSTLRRVLTILKTLVGQIDVLETMTPLDFLSFRNRLESASGFESFQFREFEFALGMKSPAVLDRFADHAFAFDRLQTRLEAPSVWQRVLRYLAAQGAAIPTAALERDPALPTEADADVQSALVDVYRGDAALMQLCERLIDLDEGVQEWRYRHVKMVQRTIGTKRGTGGSAGVEYLQSTLFKPVFPDLWAIRADL
ncbi:MAG: tryptophan 2,3-dioxygenase [Acidobacteria bacterium]|nr:tryptophan 2,3-dioxygenase [Acidobacteriota bacterium]